MSLGWKFHWLPPGLTETLARSAPYIPLAHLPPVNIRQACGAYPQFCLRSLPISDLPQTRLLSPGMWVGKIGYPGRHRAYTSITARARRASWLWVLTRAWSDVSIGLRREMGLRPRVCRDIGPVVSLLCAHTQQRLYWRPR